MESFFPRRLSSYQKLDYGGEESQDGGGVGHFDGGFIGRPTARSNLFRFRRVQWRRRRRRSPSSPGFIRVKVSSLIRRKRVVMRMVRASIRKVLKRLKEGHAHFGDLFAGNYLFLQINPTSLKSLQKSYNSTPPGFHFSPRIPQS
ncbi:unnamed protein product [Linum trigynum]|uniref:Uncharacterized protein n=1 Tax=Linum trigynum TaxID=586398 RepID=A0AAV2CNQ2_9ROSI